MATGAGLLTFIVALMLHAGNPGAVSGNIAGPAFTLTLLFSSCRSASRFKRVENIRELKDSTVIPSPPPPTPSTLDPVNK